MVSLERRKLMMRKVLVVAGGTYLTATSIVGTATLGFIFVKPFRNAVINGFAVFIYKKLEASGADKERILEDLKYLKTAIEKIDIKKEKENGKEE
jgi:hypothetical protein